MGWWSDDIMGGDTPLDLQGDFEDKFGALDPYEGQFEDVATPPTFVLPTPEQSIAFIEERLGYDGEITKQVVGFMLLERGAPLNDRLRALINEGLDEDESENWNDSGSRAVRINEFRQLLAQYPDEGRAQEMPHQAGLFETIFNKLG